jgi:hypothetical protein
LTAGGDGVSQPKKAYAVDGPLFAAGRAACSGPLVSWSPGKVDQGKKPIKKVVKKAVKKPKRKAARH